MPFFVQGHSPARLALAFATVLGDMLLQAGDSHSHSNRQLPLFGGRQVPEPNQAPHPIARLDELAFEPSMFRTTYRQGRERALHIRHLLKTAKGKIASRRTKSKYYFSPYFRPADPP